MDPQSLVFTPQNDIWHLSTALRSFQDVQQEHAERLLQIERRQDEDARLKSVWGPSSHFPGLSGGISQQGNNSQGINDDFTSFDEDRSSNMIRNLHIDNDEEPRRSITASRANSVRFDETANLGQWAHGSRSSSEFVPSRTSSGSNGLGGHLLSERTISHKSDGRHSSAGQSVISGRANSLGIDASQALDHSSLSAPGLAPGLFILGTVPAIIRCWMNSEFTHDALLYAAVCTGSYRSFLDSRLVNHLRHSRQVSQDLNGTKRVKLPVYLPEAVPHTSSSQSSSPTLQLPSLTIEFNVIEMNQQYAHRRSIQIYIGSDVLRTHNADIFFSSNSLSMFDDDRNHISIPLVRPENDETFKSLRVTSSRPSLSGSHLDSPELAAEDDIAEARPSKIDNRDRMQQTVKISKDKEECMTSNDHGKAYFDSYVIPVIKANPIVKETNTCHQSECSHETHGSVSDNTIQRKATIQDMSQDDSALSIHSPTIHAAAAGTDWRYESGNLSSTRDWANVSRSVSGSQQRRNRDQGIKILKPTRQGAKPSMTATTTSPVASNLHLFDDGKRLSRPPGVASNAEAKSNLKRPDSNELSKTILRENSVNFNMTTKQSKGSNPIGGASAFGWLNSPTR